MVFKKEISFGKIDFNGSGRRINMVVVEVRIDDPERESKEDVRERGFSNRLKLAICADVWNSRGTDVVMAGQCLDSLLKYFNRDDLFNELYRLWKEFHLNDMKSGTPRQLSILKEHMPEEYKDWYATACKVLTEHGAYEVPAEEADPYRRYDTYRGKPHKFGHEWLFHEIPYPDRESIKNVIFGS